MDDEVEETSVRAAIRRLVWPLRVENVAVIISVPENDRIMGTRSVKNVLDKNECNL